MTSLVTQPAPADSARAIAHFAEHLEFETDCWDVHEAMSTGTADFVLLDVRGPNAWNAGHIEGAVHLQHAELDERALARFSPETVFVVYCAGPHCNGADRAALRLARLRRPVKKMIGGTEGWKDEGFSLTR
jgi:rhodanese-related sulfurtransferase